MGTEYVAVNPADKISTNFTWGEYLYLNDWQVYACPTLEVYKNLLHISTKMQWFRDYFGRPIRVTSGWRPRKYNDHIGGAFRSAHLDGMAVDFQVAGIPADRVRNDVKHLLAHLDIRMENNQGGSWVHIDSRSPGKGGRFFSAGGKPD